MLEIKVDLNKKCKKCGKGGATQNGYCLACIAKEAEEGRFDHNLKAIREIVEQVVKGKADGQVRED